MALCLAKEQSNFIEIIVEMLVSLEEASCPFGYLEPVGFAAHCVKMRVIQTIWPLTNK